MSAAIQILLAALGALGFALLFDIRGRKLFFAAAGGGLGWTLYLLAVHFGLGDFWGLLIGSFGVAGLSEILARRLRTPVTLLLVPMMIPMIPGGSLYRAMSDFVANRHETLGKSASHVLVEAFAIAVGILLAAYVARIILKMRRVMGLDSRP